MKLTISPHWLFSPKKGFALDYRRIINIKRHILLGTLTISILDLPSSSLEIVNHPPFPSSSEFFPTRTFPEISTFEICFVIIVVV